MYKIIEKEFIDIDELKLLKDNGIRPILLGIFTEEEKQKYYALGIYDIASTEDEAEEMKIEPTLYEDVDIKTQDVETAEVTINKDVCISKPSIIKQPVKVVLASLAVIAIAGGCLTALGLNNDVVKTDDVTAKTDKIQIENSMSSSLNAKDVIVIKDANEENARMDISELNEGATEIVKKFDTKPIEVVDVENKKWEETQKVVQDNRNIEYQNSNGETVTKIENNELSITNGPTYNVSGFENAEDINIYIEDTPIDETTSSVETEAPKEEVSTIPESSAETEISKEEISTIPEVENTNNDDKVEDNSSSNSSLEEAVENIKNETEKMYEQQLQEELNKSHNLGPNRPVARA